MVSSNFTLLKSYANKWRILLPFALFWEDSITKTHLDSRKLSLQIVHSAPEYLAKLPAMWPTSHWHATPRQRQGLFQQPDAGGFPPWKTRDSICHFHTHWLIACIKRCELTIVLRGNEFQKTVPLMVTGWCKPPPPGCDPLLVI